MKLKKQFSKFYAAIRIHGESQNLIDKRKTLQADVESKFPDEMKKHDIDLKKSDIKFFDQGSYRYNTTINTSPIDRDVAVKIPLDIVENPDPRKIKIYLYDALNTVSTRTVCIKEPCVNVAYFEDGEEWMHIDMPLYAEHDGQVYLARGKRTGNYKWELADPEGLNEDLCEKINGNAQLRRIICFIKKWRDEKYVNSTLDNEIPPSIGLTYLACDCFDETSTEDGDDDLQALQKTMEKMMGMFKKTYEDGKLVKADITRLLPVQPYSDIFKKMKEASDDYGVKFYNRLSKAVENLTNALNVENDYDAGIYVQKVLGDKFELPEKPSKVASTQSKKEHSFG